MAILKDLTVNGTTRVIGPVHGQSFIRHGGTSTQLLKADGNVVEISSIVSLPSGYSDTTGITLSTSALTTIASINGVALNLKAPAGGGGGGSEVTIPGSDITLSTSASTYVSVDGTSRKMQLPTSAPSTWLGTASTACASGNHSHGNIDSAGQILNNVSISSGCRLAIINTDSKVARSSTVFGASSGTYLKNDGTWDTPSANVNIRANGNITATGVATANIQFGTNDRQYELIHTSGPTITITISELYPNVEKYLLIYNYGNPSDLTVKLGSTAADGIIANGFIHEDFPILLENGKCYEFSIVKVSHDNSNSNFCAILTNTGALSRTGVDGV